MAEPTRNLCAQLPIDLHSKVRARQEESGKNLGQYMTWLITTFYEMEERSTMSKGEKRTVAFQVPQELFDQLKEYLQKKDIKQNAFFLKCIQKALAEDAAGN